MTRLSDLINVHLKETEAVIAQSSLLLQKKNNGQSGELKTSGKLVETYIRNFIKQIAPDSIRVTSGYIVSPESFKEEKNLAQHDIILSHKITPPIFSILEDKIDIIPVESMVGIIEIKRTLTRESLEKAQLHIIETYVNVIKYYKTKELENNTIGVSFKPGTQSPMFGIIALTSELTQKDIREIINPSVIDFVWAFQHNESFVVGDKLNRCLPTVSRKGIIEPRMLVVKGENTIVFSKLKGIIRFWLSNLASQWINAESIDKYFVKIWDSYKPNDTR